MSRSVLALLVAGAAFLVHLPARSGEFLFYDDERYVVRNREIESLERPWRFFTDLDTLTAPDAPTRDIYRPLRSLAYASLVALFGKDSAGPFHTASILLHAATAGLLALLLLGSGLPRWPAAAGALAFALHPVTVETTAWVCSLGDALCGFFALAAVLAWTRDRPLLAAAALVPALFAKEHAVVVPGLWLAWDLALRPGRLRGARTLAAAGAGLALAVGFLLYRGLVVEARMSQLAEGYTAWTMLAGLGWYAAGTLFPLGSTFDTRIAAFESPLALPVLAGAAALGFLVWGAVRGAARVRLACLWFLLALVPVSNVFVTLKIPTADRFLYLPLMGLAFAAGELVRRTAPWSNRLAPVALVLLAALTVSRVGDWHDDQALLAAGLRVQPKSKTLLWAEAGMTAERAVDAVLRGDHATAERLAGRAADLYGKYLSPANTTPGEQTQALVEVGELFWAIGHGRSQYAPDRRREALSRALEAYVAARTHHREGIGRATDEEQRVTAERIVELSLFLAAPPNPDLGRTIYVGLEAAAFLRQRYGVDDTLTRAKFRLIDSIEVRAQEPAKAREGFDAVLAALDRLEAEGRTGLTYLRAQAHFYRSILLDREPDRTGLERAWNLYRKAADESRAVRLQALLYAARCACVLGRQPGAEEWHRRGRELLEALPQLAQREGLAISHELANEIATIDTGTCAAR